ncbi:Inhibitor of the KinA pathway to sporulation, predicted exonuclease [Tindallia magadiensis]|uniref:Inhibitor of the KinA pathway to sporulation, predicted exonuclease n=1 Tax=Tindallia magadiensis TaxID=69895 RepID=A0A1I3C3Z4_9FIRM|nr:3'-5' exonuclease [Tindallia magadiensis]SFH68711.1 Inhibitor of the KinA pathway to sporulation, predicted exonuclease [Tindallia magadiensis]
MQRIIYDLEFNTAFKIDRKTKQLKKGNAHPKCPQEIVEVGAVKLNDEYEVIDSFQILVKPTLYQRMHPTIQKKTKITKEILDRGIFFPEAMRIFMEWIGNEPVQLCSWGMDDYNELKRNCEYHSIVMDLEIAWCDIQKMCMKAMEAPKGQQVGLKKAVTHFGIRMEERFHSALNDAVYTAKILEVLERERESFGNADLFEEKKKVNTN